MKKLKLALAFWVGIIAGLPLSSVLGQDTADITSKVFQFADTQLRASIGDLGDGLRFPRATKPDGTWKTVPVSDWTSGFFPGCLWYMYEQTNDPYYRNSAERWTEQLKPMQFFTGNHDIGFMIFNSFGNGYRLTANPEYRKVVLQAARTAVKRFDPRVGSIKSWDNPKWQYPVIIDNMMNLELLFWAVQNGEDSSLYRIAVSHAERTMNNHFRPDGSTYHVISYDSTDGSVIGGYTYQGYSDSSAWARGQAWAIYGFTMAYRFTQDKRFLNTARRGAAYFIDNLPADHIPFWDFRAPGIPDEPRDASAAAIAASGLLELSTFAPDSSESRRLFAAAESILQSLASPPYSSAGTSSRGIVLHSVTSKPVNIEVDVSLIYADYYFLEALLRYRKMRPER